MRNNEGMVCHYMDSINEYKRLKNMPIDEFASLIEFKNGVAEFYLFASYKTKLFYSDKFFNFVQLREKELNEAGYRTFSIQNNGWYSMDRTWYVWSKEKTNNRKQGKKQSIIVIIIGLLIFISYIGFAWRF